MASSPRLCFSGQDLEAVEGEEVAISGQEIVSALRDELELDVLLQLGRAHRKADRPILALADGTLIRWMLRGLRNRTLEQRLLKRYTGLLAQFRAEGIPLCSYISLPANNEFVNLLERHRPGRTGDQDTDSFEGISDRILFQRILSPGQRSAAFKSQSLVLKTYPEGLQTCYFYVHVEAGQGASEIARIEFPFWMVEAPGALDLVHATVVSECRKGNGYPVILSEAHEHAAVRAPERSLFYEMIEGVLLKEGREPTFSRKYLSKERPSL